MPTGDVGPRGGSHTAAYGQWAAALPVRILGLAVSLDPSRPTLSRCRFIRSMSTCRWSSRSD
eukprot:7330401-Prymnesium_polylepis.1